MPRPLFIALIFASVLFAPWWLSLLLILSGIIFLDFALESITAAFMIDMLYGVQLYRIIDGPFVITLVALILFFAKRILKPYIFINK